MSPAPAACVFCGEPIDDADEMSGRPPHAAHARCADAALADDRHWDAVAAASGDPDVAPAGDRQAGGSGAAESGAAESGAAESRARGSGAGRRAGCLGTLGVALLTGGALVAAAARLAGEARR